jgi:hypothetical protein
VRDEQLGAGRGYRGSSRRRLVPSTGQAVAVGRRRMCCWRSPALDIWLCWVRGLLTLDGVLGGCWAADGGRSGECLARDALVGCEHGQSARERLSP